MGCTLSLRQGAVLRPLLFAVFLNEAILRLNAVRMDGRNVGIPLGGGEYLPCLVYADDILLLSETADGLQALMDELSRYGHRWRLTFSARKSQVVMSRRSGGRLVGMDEARGRGG